MFKLAGRCLSVVRVVRWIPRFASIAVHGSQGVRQTSQPLTAGHSHRYICTRSTLVLVQYTSSVRQWRCMYDLEVPDALRTSLLIHLARRRFALCPVRKVLLQSPSVGQAEEQKECYLYSTCTSQISALRANSSFARESRPLEHKEVATPFRSMIFGFEPVKPSCLCPGLLPS